MGRGTGDILGYRGRGGNARHLFPYPPSPHPSPTGIGVARGTPSLPHGNYQLRDANPRETWTGRDRGTEGGDSGMKPTVRIPLYH